MQEKIQQLLDILPEWLETARRTNDANYVLDVYGLVKEVGTVMKELADTLGLDVTVHTPID